MRIETFVSQYLSSNMYLIEEKSSAILIDPFIDFDICQDLKKRNITVPWLYITHEHFDHISGVNWWREQMGCTVICSSGCLNRITDARQNLSHYFNIFEKIQSWAPCDNISLIEDYVCRADTVFENERMNIWEGHKLYFHETPGHSQGSSCMVLDDKYLFSGDSLLRDYPIVTRKIGGNQYAWNQYSKPWLNQLSREIIVMPGHFESFRLADYRFLKGV